MRPHSCASGALLAQLLDHGRPPAVRRPHVRVDRLQPPTKQLHLRAGIQPMRGNVILKDQQRGDQPRDRAVHEHRREVMIVVQQHHRAGPVDVQRDRIAGPVAA